MLFPIIKYINILNNIYITLINTNANLQIIGHPYYDFVIKI